MGNASTTEADTRSAILRVAGDLFAARGYDAVSVREIVLGAGVTKPALYYYFGSKEGVARELIEEFFAAAAVIRQDAFGKTKEVRELLELHSREMLALAQRFKNTLAFAFSLWFGRSSLHELIQKMFEHDQQVMDEWRELLISRGQSERVAEVTIKAYWALLLQELMKVVQCPEFTGCAHSLANEIASLVLNGAQAFNQEPE